MLAASFERDGCAIVRGVVAAAELAVMHDVFATLIPEGVHAPGSVREITGAARAFEPLMRIARDRRFGAIAAQLFAAPRVQLLQDSLLYKPAHDGGAVEWHQDRTYVGFLVPQRVVSLRIALFAEDEANGCMQVVDGSHRWGPIGESRALRDASVASLVPALEPAQRARLEQPRSLVLAAGDVSIHHDLTLHRSGVNHSARPRRTIILRMFDAECRLDPARLPTGAATHFPTDADGRLLERAFPITHP